MAAPKKRTRKAAAKKVSIVDAIEAAERAPLRERLVALDQLERSIDAIEDDDEQARARGVLDSAREQCIELASTDADARAGLIAAVRAEPWRDERIEMLATLPGDEAYELVRERALAQLDREYHDTDTTWLFALGEFAKHPRADDARAIVVGAFDRLVKKRGKSLVNAIAFGALGYAAIGFAEMGPVLHEAFRVAAGMEKVDAHYNLNQAAGQIAVALAAIDYTKAQGDIEAFIGDDRESDEEHVAQCRYAIAILARDATSALAHLRTADDSHKNLGFDAAACADLDHKAARGKLTARVGRRGHAVAKAAFAEALQRLDKQKKPPAVGARMIWMFGRRSPAERALGAESDNVFRQRAAAGR